ncbi:hypothetical protein BT69DRAFT_935122 [Atractiella rhizophila]|nr:hypothetical protein BT69DRAFT_935122 [Atractiella rhizophila]
MEMVAGDAKEKLEERKASVSGEKKRKREDEERVPSPKKSTKAHDKPPVEKMEKKGKKKEDMKQNQELVRKANHTVPASPPPLQHPSPKKPSPTNIPPSHETSLSVPTDKIASLADLPSARSRGRQGHHGQSQRHDDSPAAHSRSQSHSRSQPHSHIQSRTESSLGPGIQSQELSGQLLPLILTTAMSPHERTTTIRAMVGVIPTLAL